MAQRSGPPPPPPPPGFRGGGAGMQFGAGPPPPPPAPGGGGFQVPPRPGPPQPMHMPMPMPMPMQPQMPRIKNSIKYSDITPRTPRTEEDSRKKLTTYLVYSIRKQNSKDGGTWAKAEFHKESLAQEDIVKLVKRLNDSGPPVAEKKAKLFPFQQTQVTTLLDSTMNEEPDPLFEWSLAQLNREERKNKSGKRETTTISVFLKRTPQRDISALALQAAIDRKNSELNERLMRPPQPPMHPPMHHGGPGGGPGPGAAGGGPQIVKLGGGGGGGGGKGGKGRDRDDFSSSESESDSDDSRTTYSSDTQISSTISSEGSRHRRKSSHKGRSYSRHRPTHRQHYINERRIESPEARYPRERSYVPEVPRAVVPLIDPVAAAYQAGKNDAQAERFGLDRPAARLEPRAVISYGPSRYDDRHEEPRHLMREEYDRSYPRDDYLRQRREAEEYIERRPRVEQYYEEPRSPLRGGLIREYRESHPLDTPYREPRIRESSYRDSVIRDIPIRRRYSPSVDSWP